jgi:hypothetical protein
MADAKRIRTDRVQEALIERTRWGELWLVVCAIAAVLAVKSGDLPEWWLWMTLAAILAFFLLNVLQGLVEAAQKKPEIYDQERAP